MKTSDRGIAFLKRQEGLRLEVYDDGYGFLTVGYGHRVRPDEELGGMITEPEAEEILRLDLEPGEQAIDSHVAVLLEQHQFDALSSFVFNVGPGNFVSSTLLKLLNQSRFDLIPQELGKWRKSAGKVSAGLVARRKREAALFSSGDYGD